MAHHACTGCPSALPWLNLNLVPGLPICRKNLLCIVFYRISVLLIRIKHFFPHITCGLGPGWHLDLDQRPDFDMHCLLYGGKFQILDWIGYTQYCSCCNISKCVNFNVETGHRPQALYTSCSCKVSSTMEQTQPQIVTIWSVKKKIRLVNAHEEGGETRSVEEEKKVNRITGLEWQMCLSRSERELKAAGRLSWLFISRMGGHVVAPVSNPLTWRRAGKTNDFNKSVTFPCDVSRVKLYCTKS